MLRIDQCEVRSVSDLNFSGRYSQRRRAAFRAVFIQSATHTAFRGSEDSSLATLKSLGSFHEPQFLAKVKAHITVGTDRDAASRIQEFLGAKKAVA